MKNGRKGKLSKSLSIWISALMITSLLMVLTAGIAMAGTDGTMTDVDTGTQYIGPSQQLMVQQVTIADSGAADAGDLIIDSFTVTNTGDASDSQIASVSLWKEVVNAGFDPVDDSQIGSTVIPGAGDAAFTTDGTTTLPTIITVTAPTVTADFTAALYDAAGTTELVAPIVSTGDDSTADTVELSYTYEASTAYTVKITAADEAGDYTLADDGDPAGSGGPISIEVLSTGVVIGADDDAACLTVADGTSETVYVVVTLASDATEDSTTIQTELDGTDLTTGSASAWSDDGIETATSATILDTHAPTYDSAITGDSATGDSSAKSKIYLKFTEAVGLDSGTIAIEDFSVTNPARTVTAVTSGTDYVILTLDSDLPTDATPDVTLVEGASISDLAGYELPGPITRTASDGLKPEIIEFEAQLGAKTATVKFSEGVYTNDDGTGALVKADLTYSNGATTEGVSGFTSISHIEGGNIAVITLDAQMIAGDLNDPDTIAAATTTAIYDLAGNAAGTVAVNMADDRNALSLVGGWNLVSLPKVPSAGWDILNNLSDPSDYIVAYTYGLHYDPIVENMVMGWYEVTDMESLDAVFLKVAKPTELALSWTTDPQTAPPTKYLYSGWNLVGPNMDPATEPSLEVETVLRSLTSPMYMYGVTVWTTVFSPGYNLETWTCVSKLDSAGNIISEPPSSMRTYEGYWVYIQWMGAELAGRTT